MLLSKVLVLVTLLAALLPGAALLSGQTVGSIGGSIPIGRHLGGIDVSHGTSLLSADVVGCC